MRTPSHVKKHDFLTILMMVMLVVGGAWLLVTSGSTALNSFSEQPEDRLLKECAEECHPVAPTIVQLGDQERCYCNIALRDPQAGEE